MTCRKAWHAKCPCRWSASKSTASGTQVSLSTIKSSTLEAVSVTMLQERLLSVSIKLAKFVNGINQRFWPIGTPTKTIDLGTTEIPEEIFMELLQDIAPHWNASTYDLFNHNCNNFTNEVANLVMGHGIPEDIVNLPQEFLATPLGQSLAPMLTGMQ